MAADPLFFQALNYSSQNEDWRTEALALDLTDGEALLAITGSGDRVLNPLAGADVSVLAVDASPSQNHLLRVKIAAMRQLDHPDYVAFLGLTPATGEARLAWSARLDVAEATRSWLDAHRRDVAAGLLYRGRFERWYARLAAVGQLLNGGAIRELLAFDDLDAQRRFVAERWNRPAWRGVWIAACHPLVSRLFFGDPAFFETVQVPVGETLFDRICAGLDRVLARESFMVHLVLTGRLSPDDLPPYLTPEGIEAIRPRLDNIEIVDGNLLSVLTTERARFDALSLSDLPSYLDQGGVQTLVERACQAARPGGRIVIRQFLTNYSLVPPDGVRALVPLARDLDQQDRTFNYQFSVFEVDRG